MLSLSQTVANLTSPRTINGTASKRIGDLSLAKDGKEVREVTRKVSTVAAVTLDTQTAVAITILRMIAKSDGREVEAAKAFGIASDSAVLSQAEASQALHAVLAEGGEAVTAEALQDTIDTCTAQVHGAIMSGALKAYKAFGPACLSILATVRAVDCAAIIASMPAAQAALAAQAAADKDKADKAAARKAALAGKATKPAAPATDPKAMKAAFAAFMATYKAA